MNLQPLGVYSMLKHSLLAGAMMLERIATLDKPDWRHGHSDFAEPRLSEHHARVALIERIARRHGRTCPEVAIAWRLRHPLAELGERTV